MCGWGLISVALKAFSEVGLARMANALMIQTLLCARIINVLCREALCSLSKLSNIIVFHGNDIDSLFHSCLFMPLSIHCFALQNDVIIAIHNCFCAANLGTESQAVSSGSDTELLCWLAVLSFWVNFSMEPNCKTGWALGRLCKSSWALCSLHIWQLDTEFFKNKTSHLFGKYGHSAGLHLTRPRVMGAGRRVKVGFPPPLGLFQLTHLAVKWKDGMICYFFRFSLHSNMEFCFGLWICIFMVFMNSIQFKNWDGVCVTSAGLFQHSLHSTSLRKWFNNFTGITVRLSWLLVLACLLNKSVTAAWFLQKKINSIDFIVLAEHFARKNVSLLGIVFAVL